MATKIPWTDEVWNPVTGCTKITAGCKNCYAEAMAQRFWGKRKFSDVQCHEDRLKIPADWKKPRKIFVCSMSDLFHKKVPLDFQIKVFDITQQCPQHTFLILTKCIENLSEFLGGITGAGLKCKPLPNVWLGISCSTQDDLDRMAPIALQIPAAVRFISLEPLLEDINLEKVKVGQLESPPGVYQPVYYNALQKYTGHEGFDWVIIGSESGPNRRPCSIEAVRSIVRQCHEANTPVFVKQVEINGKCENDPAKWPEELRVQEYPKCEK
jgi:protein gp37